MPYVGTPPPLVGQFKKLDSISASNGVSNYNMTYNSAAFAPATAEQLIVSVNGVIQESGSSYQISGSQLQFTDPLATGDVIDFVLALGEVGNSVTPTDGSVDIAKMSTTLMKTNAIRVNETSLTSNLTIAASENAMVAGPFTIGSSITLTINGTFTVV